MGLPMNPSVGIIIYQARLRMDRPLCASLALAESDAHKTFDMLKGMEGNRIGKNSEGQPLEVTFRMTAGGSALMSEIHGKGPENMITMFHMDGDRLLVLGFVLRRLPVQRSQQQGRPSRL